MSSQNTSSEKPTNSRKAIWILPEGTAIRMTIPTDSLPFLQKKVGGLITIVYLEHPDDSMWVNDEGLLINMERNIVASMVARQPIVGPVVIEGEVLKKFEKEAIVLDSINDVIGDFFETTGYDQFLTEEEKQQLKDRE